MVGRSESSTPVSGIANAWQRIRSGGQVADEAITSRPKDQRRLLGVMFRKRGAQLRQARGSTRSLPRSPRFGS